MFRGGPHGEAHGRKVGVVPAPYVLDVEDQGIEPAQVLIARREGGEILAVEGILGDTGARVPRVRDLLEILHVAADAVLRAEQGSEDLPLVQDVGQVAQVLGDAGRVEDRACPQPLQRVEQLGDPQHQYAFRERNPKASVRARIFRSSSSDQCSM